LQIINVADVGTIELGNIDDRGQRVKQHQYVTVRVNTFGTKAYSKAQRLKQSLEYPSMTESLSAVGLAYIDSTEVLNVTALSQSKWEQRGTFDITIGTADGNFSEDYDADYVGLPSAVAYDSDIVPIENVSITTDLVREDDDGEPDEAHSIIIDINT